MVAIVETDADVRYLVRRPGDTTDASIDSKPLPRTGFGTNSIGGAKDSTISVVEA